MNRFEGSITNLEATIKDLGEYAGKVTTPHSLHETEADLFAFAMRIALAALARAVEQGAKNHMGPIHVGDQGCKGQFLDGARPLTCRSLFGALKIIRAYHYDWTLGDCYALNARLALPERNYSYNIQKLVDLLGVENAYGEGHETLFVMLGLRVPKSMGEKIVADMAEAVADFRATAAALSVEKAPSGPKMAVQTKERQGKKKMANGWTINPGTSPVPLNRTTSAKMELMTAAFGRRGGAKATTLFSADREPDLDALQQEFFPDALPCLDWSHLKERICDAGYVRAWVDAANECLMHDDVVNAIRWVRRSLTKGETKNNTERKETLAAVIDYMDKHRMPYGVFMLVGHPIAMGSGDCMDRTGIRWTDPGAQAVVDLRFVHINGQMPDVHTHRIMRKRKRLYVDATASSADLCA